MTQGNGTTAVQKIEVEGLGRMLLRRDEQGLVQMALKTVKLEAGHDYYKIGAKGQMSAAGIDKKNEYAGCHILNPPVVVVDGIEQGNPYVETDPVQGIVRVLARKLIIGRSALGEMVAVDYTADYIPEAYHRRDLLQKISDTPEAGWLGGSEHSPTEEQKARGRWRFIPTHSNDIGLWVDLAHEDIQKIFETTDQRRLHALKIAQTIARRNGLGMHPAIGGQRFKLDETKTEGKGKWAGRTFSNYTLPDFRHDSVVVFLSHSTKRDVEDLAANVAAKRTADIRVEDVAVETPDDGQVIDATFEQATNQAEAERLAAKTDIAPEGTPETDQEHDQEGDQEAPQENGNDNPPEDEFGEWEE